MQLKQTPEYKGVSGSGWSLGDVKEMCAMRDLRWVQKELRCQKGLYSDLLQVFPSVRGKRWYHLRRKTPSLLAGLGASCSSGRELGLCWLRLQICAADWPHVGGQDEGHSAASPAGGIPFICWAWLMASPSEKEESIAVMALVTEVTETQLQGLKWKGTFWAPQLRTATVWKEAHGDSGIMRDACPHFLHPGSASTVGLWSVKQFGLFQ